MTRLAIVERFLLDFAREARAAQTPCPHVLFPDAEPEYARDRLDRWYYEGVTR